MYTLVITHKPVGNQTNEVTWRELEYKEVLKIVSLAKDVQRIMIWTR